MEMTAEGRWTGGSDHGPAQEIPMGGEEMAGSSQDMCLWDSTGSKGAG